ncbi:MAG: type II toxin-antitoxin system PemK/MazF family toxin [Thermaceae bacterium]|nr:type II toxin-antitoxin system PemK/MazF family toxin [Thermaceae bacterium]
MKQGDVYWCDLKEPDRKRPVVILTRNAGVRLLNSLSVAPVTRSVREIRSFVLLDEEDGMPTECSVNLDSIQTIAKSRFGDHITTLSKERMLEVHEAISFAFGFDALEDDAL